MIVQRCGYLLLWFLVSALQLFTLDRPADGQTKQPVTTTRYPNAHWKALTSYIDKPALGDVNGDGIPEIIGTSLFGDVFCVDGVTGQILWTYEDEHFFDLAIYICPALVDINCDGLPDVISVTPSGNVICLSGKTGRKLWSYKAEFPIMHSPSAFDLNRDGTPEIIFCDAGGNLYILNRAGLEIAKNKGPVAFYGSPAPGLIDERPVILVSDRGGSLRCFDGINGSSIWTYTAGPSPVSTSPILFKDARDPGTPWKVLIGTEAGEAHMVNASTGSRIWSRNLSAGEILGDFSLGDVNRDGLLEFVCSTSGSRIYAGAVADGRELWNRKFRIPVRLFSASERKKRARPDALTGQPVLADVHGNGGLDVIVEIRGLNNYIYALDGKSGRVIWNYGSKNLYMNPALSSSSVLATAQETDPVSAFFDTVPVFSQPTPVLADFGRQGKADLIINDRDEVGLISIPLNAGIAAGTWPKYASSPCNNIVNFSVPCVGTARAPLVTLSVEPGEITEGDSARLCWKCSVANSIEIDQGIGSVSPEDCLTVKPGGNTTWRAIARGCGGNARAEVSLAVKGRTIGVIPAGGQEAAAPKPILPAPTPAEKVDTARRALVFDLADVFFEYDWYRLTAAARSVLDENIRKLKAHPEAAVALEATCDERGSFVYNEFLAAARVESVRAYLLSRGIADARMEARPYGKTARWDSRHEESGWSLNRRVHFVILP
jgi:outer membrane protein assembly factor BamB/outer membrane protein OmpA-like peptidoglycan-associated protein